MLLLRALGVLTLVGSAFASGPVKKVLYTFEGTPDGSIPNSLIADRAGNLYGTTRFGGDPTCDCGTVFELSAPATTGGAWTESVLYAFRGGKQDGANPDGLVFDKLGNLYGITELGAHDGTVYELTPPATAGGAWTESVIFSFPSNLGGGQPAGKLTFDAAGNLYGAATLGGTGAACFSVVAKCGVVFRLAPPANPGEPWGETVLHNFGFDANDGQGPAGGLILDRSGALYGTTFRGGSNNNGTFFQLVRTNGVWTENILYNFAGSEGTPQGNLIVDGSGNLYGTTSSGGITKCDTFGCGIVFELSPPAASGDPWTETTLYSFRNGSDGGLPNAALVLDKAGDLFGTAATGGLKAPNGGGTVFELSPPTVTGTTWIETTLHKFSGLISPTDGQIPEAGLVFFKGKFYGTTGGGGVPSGLGTVFSLVIVP